MSFQKDSITIYDIARKAGVSVATVSRVLTGKSNVNKETKVKIKKIIKDLKYEPNLIARALHDKKTKTIAILVQSLTNPFFVNLCNEIDIYCSKVGYTLFIGITNNDYKTESKLMNMFEKRQVDGMILLGGRINEINLNKKLIDEIVDYSKRFPLVLINSNIKIENCYNVKSDENNGFKELIDYVISLNHRLIGLITGQRGLWPTENKIKIFREALYKNNIAVNDDWIISGEYTIESGENSMKEIISKKVFPTVVMCTNDILAIGAINQIIKSGLKCPDDISITGFDDIDISQYYYPGITTVRQNYLQLSKSAVKKITDHIAGEKKPKEKLIKTNIIIRGSVKGNNL
jgi:LacI family transcriptional regulator/LacI family purine nucleotide synthesis repressor/LacI family repressor for deo operon, udp, cdd, tsx, nupC, and nupG